MECIICGEDSVDSWCEDCWAERKASCLAKYKEESENPKPVSNEAKEVKKVKKALGLEVSLKEVSDE